MEVKYIIDTFAWVEYLSGSERGKAVVSIIENDFHGTPILVLAELSDKFARDGQDFSEILKFIKAKSVIIAMSQEVAINAGKFKKKMRETHKDFGLIDSIIYLTAKEQNARLISGDNHFKELDSVVII
ncbi:TPA: type II toxin-antitoxin system VapC family toxin [Candidatus Woesearchaeota archaeon]|nr:type II toxin-antitoxin system VapC family toxin [Candidatus Woesearchaeota archaeon]